MTLFCTSSFIPSSVVSHKIDFANDKTLHVCGSVISLLSSSGVILASHDLKCPINTVEKTDLGFAVSVPNGILMFDLSQENNSISKPSFIPSPEPFIHLFHQSHRLIGQTRSGNQFTIPDLQPIGTDHPYNPTVQISYSPDNLPCSAISLGASHSEVLVSSGRSISAYSLKHSPIIRKRSPTSDKITGLWSVNETLVLSSADKTITHGFSPHPIPILQSQATLLLHGSVQVTPFAVFFNGETVFIPPGNSRILHADKTESDGVFLALGDGILRGRGRVLQLVYNQASTVKDTDKEITAMCRLSGGRVAVALADEGRVEVYGSKRKEFSLTASVESMTSLGSVLFIGCTHGALVRIDVDSQPGIQDSVKHRFVGFRPVKLLRLDHDELVIEISSRCSLWSRDSELPLQLPGVVTAACMHQGSLVLATRNELLECDLPTSTSGRICRSLSLTSEVRSIANFSDEVRLILDFQGGLHAINLSCEVLGRWSGNFTAVSDAHEGFFAVARVSEVAVMTLTRQETHGPLVLVELGSLGCIREVLAVAIGRGFLALATQEEVTTHAIPQETLQGLPHALPFARMHEVRTSVHHPRLFTIRNDKIVIGDALGLRVIKEGKIVAHSIDKTEVTAACMLSDDLLAVADSTGRLSIRRLEETIRFVSSGVLPSGDVVTGTVLVGESSVVFCTVQGKIGCMQPVSNMWMAKLTLLMRKTLEKPWQLAEEGLPELNYADGDLCFRFLELSTDSQELFAGRIGVSRDVLVEEIDALKCNRVEYSEFRCNARIL